MELQPVITNPTEGSSIPPPVDEIKKDYIVQNEFFKTIPVEVMSGLKKLAKGIKRNVVVINWTERIDDLISKYSTKEWFVIYAGDVGKQSTSRWNITIKGKMLHHYELSRHFERYNDEWGVFKTPGTPVRDETDWAYAIITKQWCKFLIDITYRGLYIFDRKEAIHHFVSDVISKYDALEDMDKLKLRETVKNCFNFLKTSQERIKHEIKTDIKNNEREMSNHYSAIQRMESNLYNGHVKLRSFASKYTAYLKAMSEENLTPIFTNLLAKKYETIHFSDMGLITVLTKKIHITNFGKEYYIGIFEMKIYLDGKVRFINVDNPCEEYPHPHISGDVACFGNIKGLIPKMIQAGDFVGLLSVLYKFLSTYNVEGPYYVLERGWGVEADYCGRCDRATVECECGNTCTNCGERRNNCECSRCPVDDGLVSEADCQNCEDWDSDEDCCGAS